MKCILLFVFVSLAAAINPASPSQYLGSGFNARDGTYVAPLIQFTYEQGQTMTTPYSKVSYDVPDQIFFKPDQQMKRINHEGTYRSYSEYLYNYTRSYSFDVGIQTQYFGAGFYYNKNLGYVYNHMQSGSSSTMHGLQWWTYYSAGLYPTEFLKLNPMFQMALDKFPSVITTEADRSYAKEFIDTFGTHFLYKATFGAQVDFHAAISQETSSTKTAEWVNEQFGFSFTYTLVNLSFGMNTSESWDKLDKTFLKESDATVFFQGGDPSLADLSHVDDWAKTLDQNTYPMNATMMGIWRLAGDKSEVIRQYVQDYLNGNLKKRSMVSSCLGSGVDTLQLEGCLGTVYLPSSVITTPVDESQFSTFDVVMTDHFDGDSLFQYKWTVSDGMTGFGKTSHEIYRYYEQHYNEKKSLSKTVLTLAYNRFSAPILPPPELNPLFKTAVLNLPDYNNKSLSQYLEFFSTWGTAVVDEVIMGGSFEANLWYSNIVNNAMSINQIIEQSHWSVGEVIGGNDKENSTTRKVDYIFSEGLVAEYSFLGGDLTLKPEKFNQWTKTVRAQQEIVQYHLQPIWYFAPEKKADLQAALGQYLKIAQDKLDLYIESLSN